MEAGGLEVMTRLLENGRARFRQRRFGPCEETADVEHAEPDALHVKRGDGPGKRLAFLHERCGLGRWVLLQERDELVDAVAGRLAIVGHGHSA